MTTFEMIKYHNKKYPADIPLHIEEIAAHFDIKSIGGSLEKSIHTEYSYGKRKWDSSLVKYYTEIVAAQRNGIPQLWKNETWSSQFADYLINIIGDGSAPKVIEVHPPFSDYTNISSFIKNYSLFEKRITDRFPSVQILIENRFGSRYVKKGCEFILSKNNDIRLLCDEISRSNLGLRIAYDVPQIYTAYNAKTEEEFITLLEEAKSFREFIGGVHLWGKRISPKGRKVSHCGDLNSYFLGDTVIKSHFLKSFRDCFDDGVVRKMVLEVNSRNEDLESIINDLTGVRINFV